MQVACCRCETPGSLSSLPAENTCLQRSGPEQLCDVGFMASVQELHILDCCFSYSSVSTPGPCMHKSNNIEVDVMLPLTKPYLCTSLQAACANSSRSGRQLSFC